MKNQKYFILVFVLLVNAPFVFAQQDETIIVSPFIGDELDRVERDYFQLFPKIKGFKEATFFLNSDSTLKVSIVYEKDGDFRDTVLTSYRNLKQVQLHITNFVQFQINDIEKQHRGEFGVYTLADRSEVSGELLSVRRNSIIILNMTQKSYMDNEKNLLTIEKIEEDDLNKIHFKNNKWNLAYIIYPVVGMTAGIIIGGNIGQKSEDSEYGFLLGIPMKKSTVTSAMLGGLIGALIALPLAFIFPIEIGSDNIFETPFSKDDIEGLRENARYENEEPYYLQKLK
ncbi:MAG: hypothetical protein KJN64_15790 [Ignavibacteria bacterium]|nr:hypothetical protein [Ignavibacteria bacterium]NNJ52876.1 hypothetical protein [Ignavibacteriaceae bacterium]NNL20606.1 hypothetical protein [Ignavibacteriaceae bacterium]